VRVGLVRDLIFCGTPAEHFCVKFTRNSQRLAGIGSASLLSVLFAVLSVRMIFYFCPLFQANILEKCSFVLFLFTVLFQRRYSQKPIYYWKYFSPLRFTRKLASESELPPAKAGSPLRAIMMGKARALRRKQCGRETDAMLTKLPRGLTSCSGRRPRNWLHVTTGCRPGWTRDKRRRATARLPSR